MKKETLQLIERASYRAAEIGNREFATDARKEINMVLVELVTAAVILETPKPEAAPPAASE